MRKAPLLPAALALLLLLALPGGAAAADYVPGQVLVKYRHHTDRATRAGITAAAGAVPAEVQPGGSQTVKVAKGSSVSSTVRQLRRDPDVAYAVPNFKAHAAGLIPNDPYFRLQWNLSGGFGINMPNAWDYAKARGASGGRGAVIAVVDTGVAYENRGRYRRAPDLGKRFVRGYDFVDDDRHPNDANGHGTHVAGTIAQTTNNRKGTAGIAFHAKIMPLRVLDSRGSGDTTSIARAVRYAAKRKVDVINMSLEFNAGVTASDIPDIISAIRYARKKGVVIVAAAGNQADNVASYPGRAKGVIAVAATTIRGCEAEYSNSGRDVDLAAPGGGADAPIVGDPYDDANCHPEKPGRDIYQQTFTSSVRRFGLDGEEGTSMASPHVAAVAAMIKAGRVLGRRKPSPAAVERRLEETARDIGPPGRDRLYGYGLLDAAAALR